jgi:hypothetical protein
MGLLAPLWLAALAALAVPIVLHLWSRRPGRVVRVGSLRHLDGPPAESRRVRLHDPWLLALRLALLAALALALAAPFLEREPARDAPAWALVSPALLRDTAAARADRTLDSLRHAGTPIRLLAPGLAEARDGEPLPDDDTPVWSLLREADRAAPPGARLLVVAPLRLRDAVGERPRLSHEVEWRVPTQPLAVAGSSRSGGGETRRAVVLATADRAEDARYLAAAIGAVAGDSAGPPVLSADSADAAAARARPGDWLVWLGDRAAPPALERAAERGAVLLADAPALPASARDGRLLAEGMPAIPVRFRAASLPPAATVWSDGAGRPLLAARPLGAGMRLDFAGRFDAASTDLVLRPAFPALVARLWSSDDPARPADDARAVSASQLAPARSDERTARAAAPLRTELGRPLLLLAALLLVAERIVVARRDRKAEA